MQEDQRRTADLAASTVRDIRDLSPARLKLLALELQSRLTAYETASREPIAIIGMAGRYPGGGETLDEYWALLADQRVAKPARVDGAPASEEARRMTLADIDRFDAGFFGIAADDARFIDPQQRLIAEVAWLAMEDAGRVPADIGRRTGVYVAICSNDYAELIRASDEAWAGRLVKGNSHGLAAGRLSRMFGFAGPSMALDSACSSSLLAAHIAIGHLRARECDAALVAGVSGIFSRSVTRDLQQAGLLSSSGLCRPFDTKADGYVRGEGCGALILKRLSDAQRDGDRVVAIIRGSATNHDAGGTMLAPHGPAQREVMQMALANAGVDPSEVDYLEASSIGAWFADPVEVDAVGAVYGGRPARAPLHLGSAKANVGHLEGAAGVAALTKVALCLRHQAVPGHATFDAPNLNIDLAGNHCSIPRATFAGDALPRGELRFAAVSGFSLSGTNVHLILERAYETSRKSSPPQACVLPLSANEPEALDLLGERVAKWLGRHPAEWQDLCYTMSVGRKHLRYRRAIVALDAISAATELRRSVGHPPASVREPQSVVFMFLADGLTLEAASRLATDEPLFARVMLDCVNMGRKACGQPLSGNPFASDTPGRVQRFAASLALVRLLETAGAKPTLVGGDGDGEVLAGLVAGLFTLADALALVTTDSRSSKIAFQNEHTPILSLHTGLPARRGELASLAYWNDPRPRTSIESWAGSTRRDEIRITFGSQLLRVSPIEQKIKMTEPGAAPELFAALHRAGLTLDWRRVLKDKGRSIIAAPTTIFSRQSYWIGNHATIGAPAPPPLTASLGREQATELLLALLRKELGLHELRADENLLSLGIDSVELMQTVLRIEQLTGFRPPVGELYENPTVEGIVKLYLSSRTHEGSGGADNGDGAPPAGSHSSADTNGREVGWI